MALLDQALRQTQKHTRQCEAKLWDIGTGDQRVWGLSKHTLLGCALANTDTAPNTCTQVSSYMYHVYCKMYVLMHACIPMSVFIHTYMHGSTHTYMAVQQLA